MDFESHIDRESIKKLILTLFLITFMFYTPGTASAAEGSQVLLNASSGAQSIFGLLNTEITVKNESGARGINLTVPSPGVAGRQFDGIFCDTDADFVDTTTCFKSVNFGLSDSYFGGTFNGTDVNPTGGTIFGMELHRPDSFGLNVLITNNASGIFVLTNGTGTGYFWQSGTANGADDSIGIKLGIQNGRGIFAQMDDTTHDKAFFEVHATNDSNPNTVIMAVTNAADTSLWFVEKDGDTLIPVLNISDRIDIPQTLAGGVSIRKFLNTTPAFTEALQILSNGDDATSNQTFILGYLNSTDDLVWGVAKEGFMRTRYTQYEALVAGEFPSCVAGLDDKRIWYDNDADAFKYCNDAGATRTISST